MLGAHRHYQAARGDFYAAAITYFTVFAMWPLLMVGFATLGFILAGRPALLAEIDSRVKSAVPGDLGPQLISLMDAAIDSRTSVGLIGVAVALWAGLGWMSNLRSALSDVWGQPDSERDFVRTKLSDLGALVSTFLASLLTIGLTALATSELLPIAAGLRVVSVLGSIAVSWLLFTWIIARLPRQKLLLRRCARAGLLAAVGFEVFKQLASVYLRVVLQGPAGATFGPVLGLMVFAYLTARLVLFSTAWAATEPATDAVTGPRPADSATAQPGSG